TPGSNAPVASDTVPPNVALLDCANASVNATRHTHTDAATKSFFTYTSARCESFEETLSCENEKWAQDTTAGKNVPNRQNRFDRIDRLFLSREFDPFLQQLFVAFGIDVVLGADHLLKTRAFPQHERRAKSPRLGEYVGIFHRDFVVDLFFVDAG